MIAITGAKGGCGKTTTALGLASVVAGSTTPLVVDADSDMPDLHHVARTAAEPGIDAVADGQSLSAVVQQTERFPGVAVLTAGHRENVDAALRAATEWNGPVFVDCPPGLNPDAVRPLRHASAGITVTTDEPACLEDTVQTVRALRQLDVTPAGVTVITRTTQTPPPAVAGCRVVATSPAVDDPFASHHVTRSWQRLAEILDTDGSTHRETPISV